MCLACGDGSERELRRAVIHKETDTHQDSVTQRRWIQQDESPNEGLSSQDGPPVPPQDMQSFFLKRLSSFQEFMQGVEDGAKFSAALSAPWFFSNVAEDFVQHSTPQEPQSNALFDDWTNTIMNGDTVPEEEIDNLNCVVRGIAQFMENGPAIPDTNSKSEEDERSIQKVTEMEILNLKMKSKMSVRMLQVSLASSHLSQCKQANMMPH